MNATTAEPDTTAEARRHLPGEVGIWVFIGGDLLIFTLFFVTYTYYLAQNPALFAESQGKLNQSFGAINTIVLLTSSWFVASAVRAARLGLWTLARRLLLATMLCGATFITIKFFEYAEKIRAGITLNSNDFFIYYFTFTGIHLVHVLVGLGLLSFVWSRLRKPACGAGEVQVLEIGASFWHLVDLLWIVLFALLYLVKQA